MFRYVYILIQLHIHSIHRDVSCICAMMNGPIISPDLTADFR